MGCTWVAAVHVMTSDLAYHLVQAPLTGAEACLLPSSMPYFAEHLDNSLHHTPTARPDPPLPATAQVVRTAPRSGQVHADDEATKAREAEHPAGVVLGKDRGVSGGWGRGWGPARPAWPLRSPLLHVASVPDSPASSGHHPECSWLELLPRRLQVLPAQDMFMLGLARLSLPSANHPPHCPALPPGAVPHPKPEQATDPTQGGRDCHSAVGHMFSGFNAKAKDPTGEGRWGPVLHCTCCQPA